MPGMSTALANLILDAIFRAGTYTGGSVYLAVSTADPGADGSGLAEPGAADYARLDISAAFAAAAGRSITHAAVLTLTAAAVNAWGTLTHGAVCDAAGTGAGNVLWSFELATPHTVEVGDPVTVPAGLLAPGFPWS